MVQHIQLIAQFEKFISASGNGKRCKLSGEKLKPSTVKNYTYILKLLQEYEAYTGKKLLILYNTGHNNRMLQREKNYWAKFYKDFTKFLYFKKGCHDNFCGHVFKIIKCFFRYLKNQKLINLNPFYESFYVKHEDIRVISLLPEQLAFLILDKPFHQQLNTNLRITKDQFVFGCTTALRFSDLMNLRVRNLEKINNEYFLNYVSLKTETPVKVKLPMYAVNIFLAFSKAKSLNSKVFPSIALSSFNNRLKKIGALAAWTQPIGKFRKMNGRSIEQKKKKLLYRFCDLLSSHVMRKTGITFLLALGMPEYVVRKISGHAAHSPSFFRYVNFAQSFINEELNTAHSKLLMLYYTKQE
ncbi:MAG: tyrosine-type recombinase/integrase [Chitinophagaceae bacterium]|nr:tyrosine-type recombinase/integrase [Chitinophagaceae bacterium]